MSSKAIFLDRDDTLIEDPGYINNPKQVKLLDGVPEALIKLKAMGYKLVVASNQSAVARGIVTEKVLDQIHDRLKHLLAEKGAFLDGIYYCPYHPDGIVAKYRKESDCRKPKPGMLLAAADEMDIDLGQSWSIGNSARDVEAGLQAGCKTILIDTPSHQKRLEPGRPAPDYTGVNITEAVNIIKKYHRSSGSAATKKPSAPKEKSDPDELAPEPDEPAPESDKPAPELDEPPSEPDKQTPDPDEPPCEPDEQTPEPDEPATETHEPSCEPDEPPSEPNEQPSQSESRETQTDFSRQESPSDTNEQLLSSILEHLKAMQRDNMFGDFSITRLLAGIVQIAVLFCLLISIWFLMSPNRQIDSVVITLGFAMVLQVMTLTFYTMQGRK